MEQGDVRPGTPLPPPKKGLAGGGRKPRNGPAAGQRGVEAPANYLLKYKHAHTQPDGQHVKKKEHALPAQTYFHARAHA